MTVSGIPERIFLINKGYMQQFKLTIQVKVVTHFHDKGKELNSYIRNSY